MQKGPGQPAELRYLGHVVMEHRNGLAVQATVTPATGTARTGGRALDGAHAGWSGTQDPAGRSRPRYRGPS